MTNYLSHFGLREAPFARNQHPKWIYLSPQNKEDILKMRWAMEEYSGLALLRGDVGMGKSSLIEYMMTGWSRYLGWKCAKLQNSGSINSPRALLAEIVSAFGLPPAPNTRTMVGMFETWLLAQSLEDKPVVLFIDEAQSLGLKALPVLRDLLNLQTRDRIVLQIVLAGQLELERKLKSFPALRSRIASAITLGPLTLQGADAMLLHRFTAAGASDPFKICTASASRMLFECSRGISRDLVTLADAAMKEAYLRGAPQIAAEHVRRAVEALSGRQDEAPELDYPEQEEPSQLVPPPAPATRRELAAAA